MSTIIKFELKELKKLAKDKNSCVVEKKVTQNLALQPWCLGNLKESIKNILDYKIGKFDKEINGILLSYKNLLIPQTIGTIRNDNSDIHFQVQAEYFIFRPYVGATLTGIVNKKSTTHLAILLHRVFNVVIPRPTEEPGNKWVGSTIQEGQQVTFRIVVLDLYGALPYIRGELDERCLKMGPDGDDENDVAAGIGNPIIVPYVDFDKTKPYTQKQSEDGDCKSTLKTNLKTPTKEQNGKSPTKVESNTNTVVEKVKNKRHSKLDTEQKQTESGTKILKKHKREA